MSKLVDRRDFDRRRSSRLDPAGRSTSSRRSAGLIPPRHGPRLPLRTSVQTDLARLSAEAYRRRRRSIPSESVRPRDHELILEGVEVSAPAVEVELERRASRPDVFRDGRGAIGQGDLRRPSTRRSPALEAGHAMRRATVRLLLRPRLALRVPRRRAGQRAVRRAVGEPPEWQPILLGGLFKRFERGSWANGPGRDEGIAEIERRAAELRPAADPLARALSRQHPVRDARGDLREAVGPHRRLRAGGVPPGVRGRARPDRARQRADRRRGLRAAPARRARGGRAGAVKRDAARGDRARRRSRRPGVPAGRGRRRGLLGRRSPRGGRRARPPPEPPRHAPALGYRAKHGGGGADPGRSRGARARRATVAGGRGSRFPTPTPAASCSRRWR